MDENAKLAPIADEIARLTGSSRQEIGLRTRVYQDAGLSGTDYFEFLIWFSHRYSVDLSGLNMSKLAPSEGSGLGSLWPKRYLELTVQDFVDLSGFPSWEASGLTGRVGVRRLRDWI